MTVNVLIRDSVMEKIVNLIMNNEILCDIKNDVIHNDNEIKNLENFIEKCANDVLTYLKYDTELNELSIVVSNENEVRALNACYRQKDSTTNVLSFPFEGSLKDAFLEELDDDGVNESIYENDEDGIGDDEIDCIDEEDYEKNVAENDDINDDVLEEFSQIQYLGDVIIDINTVQKESVEYKKPLQHHLVHLIIHSILHLIGYDHMDDEDAKEMEDLEKEILNHFGVVILEDDDGGVA